MAVTGTELVEVIGQTGTGAPGATEYYVTTAQIAALAGGGGVPVHSDTTGITGADQVLNIVSLTQAEYDAIADPNTQTLYVITDA